MQDDESAVSHTRLAYLPALDGMRACAVLAVMMFHGGIPHMDGGFMGVDAFFVLSGFLITSLLIGEWRQALTIRLGAFWARRARRLLPALLLMLLFVAFFASVIVPKGTYGALRLDALATLLYVSNWHFILVNSNYFNETSASSPLLHTWSLAVEEQFYVIWPLVVLGVHALHPEPAGAVRPVLRGGDRFGALDAPRVPGRPQHQPGLSRHRYPLAMPVHRLRAGRRARARLAAPSRNGSPGQGGTVATGDVGRTARLRCAGGPRGSRRRRLVGGDHLDVHLPLLGRVLPHRAVGGRRHPGRGGGAPQPGAQDAVVGADPLRGPHFVRAVHLALADLHLARSFPDGVVRLRALRRAGPRDLRRVGRVVPSRRAPDPHGHVRQPVAGVAGGAGRRRCRAGGRHRGDHRDDGARQYGPPRWWGHGHGHGGGDRHGRHDDHDRRRP